MENANYRFNLSCVDTIFLHLTLAHKLHIDTSNVAKIYLATLFVEKMALTQINVVSNDIIGL